MTVEYCASVCAEFTYVAVEYGGECEPLKGSSHKLTDVLQATAETL
jgi:hypothetical protein